MKYIFFLFYLLSFQLGAAQVVLGIDQLFTSEYEALLQYKKIGLITNHTAVNGKLEPTAFLLQKNEKKGKYTLAALFAPEHGLTGSSYASEEIQKDRTSNGIPIHSLYGDTRYPTKEMLNSINLLIYDIQDIGCRSYTYISTLFYVMEAAAKYGIPLIVLDRPNPINGVTVDGPMLEEKWRSMVGYINIPYCHGMTIGELAQFFNGEYKIGCNLTVIPMKGWKRRMTFQDTGLKWIPTSPQIPNAMTVYYYPITGLLGELQLVNIGVGYTLPFQVVGAPWINAIDFAQKLNNQNFPGVIFYPFYYRPFFGRFAKEECQGVLIVVTQPDRYQPVAIQYLLLGMLKILYPKQFQKALEIGKAKLEMFHKLNGTEEVYNVLKKEKFVTWPLRSLHQEQRKAFLEKRKAYLIKAYE